MADIAVPFADEKDETSAPEFSAPISFPLPSGDYVAPTPIALPEPAKPKSPAEMTEEERRIGLKRAKLQLEAATNEVERLKPTLEKILLATGMNIREGAVSTTKKVVGNLTRLQADLTAPSKPEEIGTPKWFIKQGLLFATGQQVPALLNQLQDQSNPESLNNIARQAGMDLAAEGVEQARRASEMTEDLGGGLPTQVAGFLGSTAGASAPALLAGPFGIGTAATAAGLTSFGGTIDDFKEKLMALDPKLSEDEAFKKALLPAGIVGTVTGLLTRGFGGLEKLTETVAKRGLTQAGVKQMVGESLKSAALEMPEEFLDQLSQGIVEKAFVDPNKQWKDIFSDAAVAGLTALPTSLGTAGAISGTALGAAKTVQTAAQVQERSRLRRVVADAERFRDRLRIQMEEENAKGKVTQTGGLPAQQGESSLLSPAKQTETGAAQRSGAGEAQPGATPVASTSEIVADAAKTSTPPPIPEQPKVAVFGGYQFNNPDMPTYKIPGIRGMWRDVSADTARGLGYVVPESIPTYQQWEAAGRPVPPPPGAKPKPATSQELVRYTHRDGKGLLDRSAWDLSKLTDDEELELPELLDYGLQQPRDVPSGSQFFFTRAGKEKHARLIELIRKASKSGGLVETKTISDTAPVWTSTDGQVALPATAAGPRQDTVASMVGKRFTRADGITAIVTPSTTGGTARPYRITFLRGETPIDHQDFAGTESVAQYLKDGAYPGEWKSSADSVVTRESVPEVQRRLPGMTVKQIADNWFTDPTIRERATGFPGGWTRFMHAVGAMAKTAEDVAALRKLGEDVSIKMRELMKAGKMEEAMQMIGTQPAEAYEYATGVKIDGTPKWDTMEKLIPGYVPPVPDAKYNEAKAQAQQASGFDWKQYVTQDDAGYQVLNEPKLIEALKSGLLKGNTALDALLVHLLQRSDLHPLKGIRLLDMTPQVAGDLSGTGPFHGRFFTSESSGNVGTIELAMLLQDGSPMTQLGFLITLTHELLHNNLTSKLANAPLHLVSEMQDLFMFAKQKAEGTQWATHNAMSNVHEFFAEGLSEPEFQKWLLGLDYAGRSKDMSPVRGTVLGRFLDLVRQLFNLPASVTSLNGQQIPIITALDQMVSLGQQLEGIQRERGLLEAASPAKKKSAPVPPPPLPTAIEPNLPEAQVAAGAAAVGRIAEKVVADRENAGAALEGLAYERKQYRNAVKKLNELRDMAMGRFLQMNPDANEESAEAIGIPNPDKGIEVEEDGLVVVGSEFTDALSFLNVPHDPANVQALQAEVFIERSAKRLVNLRKQIAQVETALKFTKQIKAAKKEQARVGKILKGLKTQAKKLSGMYATLTVEERADEMEAAEELRTERMGKRDALGLAPVQDFFGRQVGEWRYVQEKINEGITFLNTMLSKASTPEEQLAATKRVSQFVNLPGDVMDAVKGGRELTDDQKSAVYSALAMVFEEFDLRSMEMKSMADARLPELAKKIREQLVKIADTKIESGMAQNLVADVLATLNGETGRSGNLTSQKRQLRLKEDIDAIKSFAMALSNDIDTNGALLDWLINPTTMKPILPPGTTVGVGENTFNMILDEVKENPEFGSAILTLINSADEKLANLPVVGLTQIEEKLKQNTDESIAEARAIARRMLADARSKAAITDRTLRELLAQLAEMEVEQRSLQEGLAMFAELAGDPDFRVVRDHIARSPYGLVEPMVPSNHVETTFKAFGGPGIPSHGEVVLNSHQDQNFKAQWFQKVWQWYDAAQKHLDAYDAALANHLSDPASNPSPLALGYDVPKVRGLRDAVSRAVPGAFLELSLNAQNKRWRVPNVVRALSKFGLIPLFRQHGFITQMVGGITGTDLRTKLADFVNHYQIGQQIRDQFRDLPDKLNAALKSHPEFLMNIQLYREHWNEMAHWGRMFGSPLQVGFVLPRTGRAVTEADMRLLARNREYSEQLRRRVTETNPTLGIRQKTPTRTLVRPGASVGDEGMPRFRNRSADNFIEQVIQAYGEPAGSITGATNLGPTTTDAIAKFWNTNRDLLIQHVLDVNRNDRTMRMDPKMVQAYRGLMNQWLSTGTRPALSSLDDLVNQLMPFFTPTPGMNARDQLVGFLSGELRQYRDVAKGIVNERNTQEAARNSGAEIAFSADNEFTRPAAKLELPSPLYDYGALSASEHLVLSSRANHERIVAYANAINRAVAEMKSRKDALGKTLAQDVVAENYGGDLREMNDVLELLQKIQQDFRDAYDSGSFLRAPRGKINDTLGLLTSAVLALPSVGIRNLTAGQFEVYLMSRAMGNAGHWVALGRVVKNLAKTMVRVALQIGEGIVKNANLGVAMLTGTNRHLFENAVRSFADAITGGQYGLNATRVASLGMDGRESFRQRLTRILQETGEFSNLEESLTTWKVKGRKVGSTAAVPVKVIRALFDKIGVQQFDFALNSTALTYAEWLVKRMKEVALAYGQARTGLGQFDPTNRAWDMKPEEWGKFAFAKENEDALAFFRLFAEQGMGAEGFQLERSMWNWYQAQLTNPQAPLLTDRQMDALQRKLLADFNASTPANRPSAIPGNPTVRNLLLLQGYVSDGVLKILNTTLGSVRDRAGFAKVAAKAPIIAMLALTSIILGLMQGVAGGAWEKYFRGRMTSLPTPIDKDFYTSIKKFAEGTVGLAASNFMYIGDLILWIAGEVRGNRGFDPHMRVFGLSVLQRAINAIRGTWATANGSQNFGAKSLVPISDALKSMTPFWYEIENAMDSAAGELKQGERVARGEYASQGLLPVKGGFTMPQYGPTTVSRRLLGDYISEWNRYKDSNPVKAQSALDKAKEEVAKLEAYHYQQYLNKGYTEEQAREKAKRDTWNDYQEINPAVAALLGRRPTADQHEAMLKGLRGDRLAAVQRAEQYWKNGAMALFNREGYITREEGEASRAGLGYRRWQLPGMPRIELGVSTNPFRRTRMRTEPSAPARRVSRTVKQLVGSPLRKVKSGRRLVRRMREKKRKSPSVGQRKQSVVRRVQFAPYSFA